MEFQLTRPRERWFFLFVLPLGIAIEWAFASTLDWTAYPRSEWVALIDLCIFLPLVYFSLFKSDLPLKARLIRAAGIAGFGLFASSFIVPQSNQYLIGQLSNFRNAMLVVVLVFEAWVFWKIIGAVYRKNADAKSLEREFAIPEWAAKLLVFEAKFWKAVWALFKRK